MKTKKDTLDSLTDQILTEAEKSKKVLNTLLHNNIIEVVFVKVDGEKRRMRCTLQEKYLPPKKTSDGTQERMPNPSIVTVWDLDKDGWRSFKLDTLISVEIVK